MPEFDYDGIYAELEARKPLNDQWYSVGVDLFHRVVNDGQWTQLNEYRFTRQLAEGFLTIDLRSDVLHGAGGTARAEGLDYLINLLQANGGVLDGVKLPAKQRAGKVRLKPPYKVGALNNFEKAWHRTMPVEREQLQEIVRYDEEIGRLYWVVNIDEGRYEEITSAPAYFITVAGSKVARWRVISQLLFDNPYGIEDLDECRKVLKNMPTNDAEWLATRKLTNEAYIGHMDSNAPEFKERKWLRQSAAVLAMKAKHEAKIAGLSAEVVELQKQLALYKKYGKAYMEKKEEYDKAVADGEPTTKPTNWNARIDRQLRRANRGVKP